jgi:rhodanese-related sulfurtransferase
MKKFIKKNAIFLAALLAVIVLITVLLVMGRPSVSYKISPKEITAVLSDSGNRVSPVDLFNQQVKADKSYVLVDIRNSDEYAKGHIDHSVNIAALELFQNRSVSFFKELRKTGQAAILYGEDELQANGPWMLLKQVGFDHVKILQGGYSFYKKLPLSDSLLKASEPEWKAELPATDPAAFAKAGQPAAGQTGTQPVQKQKEKVIPVKKTGASGGGC